MATLESLAKNIEFLTTSLATNVDFLATKIASLDKKMDERFDELDKKIDDRVDELAAMTARSFSEASVKMNSIKETLDGIDERLECVEENYATKADLVSFGKDVNLMIGKHLGIFRKEHDGLAKRTKDLEKMVFAT